MSTLPDTDRMHVHHFNGMVLEMFHDQAQNVEVYASFLSHIGVDPSQVKQIADIPYLPIQFFKSHEVLRDGLKPSIVFSSSGTGKVGKSRHFVADVGRYTSVSQRGFEMMYTSLDDWAVFALLPSYIERGGSSLICMVDHFIKTAGYGGDFYLQDYRRLLEDLVQSKAPNKLLIGVSFALLDFSERKDSKSLEEIDGLVVMETGGMKGRRTELTRMELHGKLCHAFGLSQIHSEYGMTELFSQAYAREGGLFECPPWMQISIRAVDDPFSKVKAGKTGGINVIDLANRDSCAFIATDDLGRLREDGKFEVLGRFDHSDLRGCNLLVGDD